MLRWAHAVAGVAALVGLTAVGLAQAPPDVAPAGAAPPPPGVAGELAGELAQELRGEGPTLSAEQAAARAVKTSPDIDVARAAVAGAQAAADGAMIAVYPRLDLEARYTRLSNTGPVVQPDLLSAFMEPLPGVPAQAQLDPSIFERILDNYSLQARLTYPVSDVFLRVLKRQDAAQASLRATHHRVRARAADTAMAARDAYYAYVRARAALFVARRSLAQSEAQAADVAARVKAGTLARVETLRADAVVASRRVAVARSEGQVAVARTSLYTVMGEPDSGSDPGVAEDLEAPLPALPRSRPELTARALEARSEVRALRDQLRSQELTVSAEVGGEWPSLEVGGTAELENPNRRWANNDRVFRGSWSLYAGLRWSPNDLAIADFGASQARAELARTRADLAALENALRIEVAQAFEAYRAARQAAEAAQAGIVAAQESYRVRRERFREGAAVATDVIDAENELRTAHLELINTAIDGRVAAARLSRAIEGDALTP